MPLEGRYPPEQSKATDNPIFADAASEGFDAICDVTTYVTQQLDLETTENGST